MEFHFKSRRHVSKWLVANWNDFFFFTKSQQTMMLQVSAHPIYLTIFSVRSTCPLFEEGCYMFTLNFLMQFMSVKKKRIENSHSDYKYQ